MEFTKEQLSELISKHSEKENGLQDLMEMMLEHLMLSERKEYLNKEGLRGNKCNGFRPGRTYGHGRTLNFRIPRDRYGNFHPCILAILREQEDECERLAGSLYSKGLTQEQVAEVFNDVYGEHYSKASISRMVEYLRKDVSEWLERSLERRYPIVFIDCVHIKVHRRHSVETEAFYVILAVKEDKTREVLGICNKPTESATGWKEILEGLRERGLERIGLLCADGLKGLDDVVGEVFPGTALQRCTTHLKRNIIGSVRNSDKREVAEELRQMFRTGDSSYTTEKAWECWQQFCAKWGRDYRSIGRRIFHIPELSSGDTVDDIHHQLDRAPAEGLPARHEDAWGNAQRGIRNSAHGKDGHGQTGILQTRARNRDRQETLPRKIKKSSAGAPAEEITDKLIYLHY